MFRYMLHGFECLNGRLHGRADPGECGIGAAESGDRVRLFHATYDPLREWHGKCFVRHERHQARMAYVASCPTANLLEHVPDVLQEARANEVPVVLLEIFIGDLGCVGDAHLVVRCRAVVEPQLTHAYGRRVVVGVGLLGAGL